MSDEPMREGVRTPEGRKKFRDNYDHIKWSEPQPVRKSGTYFMVGQGEDMQMVHEDDLTPEQLKEVLAKSRRHDATGIVSEALGINPNQIPEFEKFQHQHGIEGVKYDPDTGACHIRDRATKLKLMKARGMVDFNEVQGGSSRG